MLLNKKTILIILSTFLLLIQSCASVKVITDETFNSIAKYEYGQDRTNLTKFSYILDSLEISETSRTIAEENILDFLQSDATFASKQFACRELRKIASENSVDILSDMLLNEKTTNIAKYALENIPGSYVDKKLAEILPPASSKIKIAIVNIFASRKSKNSVDIISKLLSDKNTDISNYAASALGKIATGKSMLTLKPYLKSPDKNFRAIVLDSYLLCLDEIAKDNTQKANIEFIELYNSNIPLNIKLAAVTGIINTAKDKAGKILEIIKSEPDNIKTIAIPKIRKLPRTTNIIAFAELLDNLSPTNKIQMLSVFEDLKNKDVKPYVKKLLKSDMVLVRIAAIKTITNIGDETDVLSLANIAAANNDDEAGYANLSLQLLKGKNVDRTIVSALQKANDKIKIVLLKAIKNRPINSAFNSVIPYTKSDNKKLSSEAFKTLAEISTDKNLRNLISLFNELNDKTTEYKLERSLGKVLTNYPTNKNAELLIENYNLSNDTETKLAILRLLGFTNDDNVLEFLKGKIKSKNYEIRKAAIQGLSNFSQPKPIKYVKQIIKSATDEKIKSIALNGFVKFIKTDRNLKPCERTELYKEALPFATTSNERNLVLDGIGHSDCFESLEVIKPYINQPDVKGTVDDCINRVSWHLHKNDPERVKKYVSWFLSKIKDDKFQKKNKFLLNVIDKFIKNRDANLN